ncbi:hypothetical protein HEP84_36105 [Streptomyces sp. RLB1-33]|uniref:hypothetical protein n=1 Tax=Streptomyces mirabilis TaxID=68239 RepID=UPI001BB0AC08|nr:hypothetical protein [Streptomyces mirabilis]QUW79290.1 hypothetical protein SMIR_09340 [Streptomyces mirabilis]
MSQIELRELGREPCRVIVIGRLWSSWALLGRPRDGPAHTPCRLRETWLILSLTRVQRRIADIEQREAERRHGEQVRPQIPDWLLEVGIGSDKPP